MPPAHVRGGAGEPHAPGLGPGPGLRLTQEGALEGAKIGMGYDGMSRIIYLLYIYYILYNIQYYTHIV